MTKDELFEEIRAHLMEAQEAAVASPWKYDNGQLVPQVRSALRHLRSLGLTTTGVMDDLGNFTTEPTEREGLLIALRVVQRLLQGDLLQKLISGELGIVYKSGSDFIDTKNAAGTFSVAADKAGMEFETYLGIALATAAEGSLSIFGLQTTGSEA